VEVDIDLIRPSPYQPRLAFDIEDLKREIERDGLLSDLVVRKRNGFYEIIDGERRWRVLKELGWNKVPVEVRDIDDRRARLSVYKLNKIRASYNVEEEARYFKKLYDGGMKAWEISKELNIDYHWILANLNVFKLPEDLQKVIFTGAHQLTISHVQELEDVIGRNVHEAETIAREIIRRGFTRDETRKLVSEQVSPIIEKERIEAAKEVIPKIEPKVTKLETPEELEKAAEALRREAKKKREEALTPEEKAALEAERKRREEERRKAEQERRKREEEEEHRIEEEARKRAKQIEEAEKLRIEEEARRKAREEALKDRKFLEQAREVWIRQEVPMRKVEKEMVVHEGTVYTVGEYECPHCKRHYLIKCDGKRDWVE